MNALAAASRSARLLLACLVIGLGGCADNARLDAAAGMGPKPALPSPKEERIPVVAVAKAVGWPEGRMPTAAPGLRVTAYAQGLDHPRWLLTLPNGDVLVAESAAPARPEEEKGLRAKVMGYFMRKAGAAVPSADRITLLRDADGDGVAEQRTAFLEGLHSPFGMTLVGNELYVANTDAIVRFPYREGVTRIDAPGQRLVELPAGPRNRHWTRNVIASPDGRWLYATVGSNSNIAEYGMDEETGRAAIWQVDRKTGAARVYASGLRNPNGLAWVPETGALWTTVNERDELGGDLVPDYMTSVRDGAFYGWPYSYFGQNVDTRAQPQRPDLVAAATVPDYALGAHTAALGLAYSTRTTLTRELQSGMFVGLHGSWNRKPPSGYQVIFVPFEDGSPSGAPVTVLSGFLAEHGKVAYGRPVGVALDRHGALLVADDVGNVVWRVTRE
jgi:glucose/arabinose dehydrogenase